VLSEPIWRGLDWGNPHFPHRKRIAPLLKGLALGLVTWILLIEVLLGPLGVGSIAEVRLLYLLYAGMCIGIGTVLMHGHWQFEGLGRSGSEVVIALFLGPLMILSLAGYFSAIVYPEIDPALGGGAGWRVEGVSSTDTSGQERADLLVFRIQDGFLTGILCPQRTGARPVFLQTATAEYSHLIVRGKASARSFLGEGNAGTCGPLASP
jgi:hypothetical protein